LSRASSLKLDDTRHAGEEGVVFAEADIETGEELRPALSNDNGACLHGFTTVGFDTRYCGLLSRPFLDEPPPLFVAMTVP
jgi:hypothetical protein